MVVVLPSLHLPDQLWWVSMRSSVNCVLVAAQLLQTNATGHLMED
jgi:hypothetical protein